MTSADFTDYADFATERWLATDAKPKIRNLTANRREWTETKSILGIICVNQPSSAVEVFPSLAGKNGSVSSQEKQ